MVFTVGGIQEEVAVQISGDGAGLMDTLDAAERGMLSFKSVVGGLGVALGALAAGGLAEAVNAARDFEQQMVELEKVTSPEIAEEMGTAIQQMAEEIPLAQSELAGIAEQAGRLGIEGVDNIKEFTRVTSEMAVSTDLTADEAANAFARITQLTGVPIENVRELGSAINELSNTMATSSSEITDSVLRAGAAMRQLGLSADETVALSAALNEVSESSERAGTRLRRLAQEVQVVSGSDLEAMAAALGLTAEEFERMREESPVELLELMAQTMAEGDDSAQALSGTLSTTSQQALAALGTNLESLNTALETSNAQFEEGTSLSKEFEAANSTFNAQLQRTRNRFRNIAITTGEVLLPALSDVLGVVNQLLDGFARFNAETNGVAGAVGLLTTAIGGLVGGGALLASQFVGASAAVSALGTALTVLTGPVGIAIALAAGLAAAYATNFGGIRDSVDAAMTRVMNILSRLEPLFADLQPVVRDFAELWATVAPYVETIVGAMVDGILGIITGLLDGMVTMIVALHQLATGDWQGAWETLTGFAERTLQGLVDYVTQWAPNLSAALLNAVADAIEAAGGALDGFLSNIPGLDASNVNLGAAQAASNLRREASVIQGQTAARRGDRESFQPRDQQRVDVEVNVTSDDEKFDAEVTQKIQTMQQRQADRVRRSTGN
jgi:TP901 family phage tail tape measure protein